MASRSARDFELPVFEIQQLWSNSLRSRKMDVARPGQRMTATCGCGARFERKATWQKLCWDCWRAKKNQEVYQDGYKAGFENGFRAGRASVKPDVPPPLLGRKLLLRMIALCHPDRHPSRQAEANEVTRLLLEIRKGS